MSCYLMSGNPHNREWSDAYITATAKQLGIAMQTLSNWNNKANQGKLAGTDQYDPDLMTALQEIKQLKRQLKVA